MMYRQTPSRSQRSKGIKVKYFLQFFVLLAICLWLLYQVKHSHEKNKEFERSDAIKLGRKDVQGRAEEISLENMKLDESANEEETGGEETAENKLEEGGSKLDMVKEKEYREGGGDDEMGEPGEEKPAAGVNRNEDLVDTEKEREVEDENGAQEADSDEVSRQIDEASSVEETDQEGDNMSVHEAREEHYKADDASSAVTHDTQVAASENENEHTGANEDPETAEDSDEGESWKDLEVAVGETARDDEQPNMKTGLTKGDVLENAENGSPPNTTATDVSSGLFANNSSEIATGNEDMSSKNVPDRNSELVNGKRILSKGESHDESDLPTGTSGASSSHVNVDNNGIGTNSTVSADSELYQKNSSKSQNNEQSVSEKIHGTDVLFDQVNNTNTIEETEDVEIVSENSDSSDGTNETLEFTETENPQEIPQDDAIDVSDTSISSEDIDARVDLDTLPEMLAKEQTMKLLQKNEESLVPQLTFSFQ